MSEQHKPSADSKEQLHAAPERAREQLGAKHEQEPASAETQERERREELEAARRSAEHESTHVEKPSSPGNDEPVRITRTDKERTYRLTLSRVQSQLPPLSKRFSRIIHNKTVERTSEVLASTVARPSGILGGAMAATVGLAFMLFFARRHGFALSGSELGLFLLAGWVIGVSLEGCFKLLRRRQ